MLNRCLLFLLLGLLPTGWCVAQEPPISPWPQFRGPTGMGVAEQSGALPESFGEQENCVWKTPIEGTGWSSPVLTDDQVWLTVARPQGEKTERRGAGGMEFTYESIDLYLLSYDRNSGEARQEINLFSVKDPGIIHSLNTFASPTPCVGSGDQRPVVYCHFGTYGSAAVAADSGEVLWRNQDIHLDHQTGPGSSPVLYQDRLIFHADGIDTQSIVALDTDDGSLAWRTERSGTMQKQADMKKAFCTPLITTVDGQDWLVSPAADWLYVYQPKTGEEVFKVPYGKLGFSTVPRPVVREQQVYFCTGFMRSRLLAVDLSGPVSQDGESRIQWAYERQVPTMPSPVLYEDRLFMVSDSGIATWLDLETGEAIWTERLDGKFASSPMLADGKIYLGNQDGDMLVLRPGDEYRLLNTNSLDAEIMASPVAVDGRLFIRTAKSLYCFEEE